MGSNGSYRCMFSISSRLALQPENSQTIPSLATNDRLLKRPSASYLKKWTLLGELSSDSLASPGCSEKPVDLSYMKTSVGNSV